MAKGNVEEQIADLARLRSQPVTDATLATLRKGLAARVNLVAAKAADVAGALGLKPLIPELLTAFDRFFKDGAKSDPQCWAKNAAAQALIHLDCSESGPFLRGFQHRQMESSWGRKVDTAVKLRSLCTLALVQCTDLTRAGKLRHLVTALTDVEESVRIDALRAIEQLEGEEAALLLRLKAAMGDKRAPVTGQALASLLQLEGSGALGFVRGFLSGPPEEPAGPVPDSAPEEIAEEAAFALGSSRLPAAFAALEEAWNAQRKPVFLQAISASRTEEGLAFLLGLVSQGTERDSVTALAALAVQRDSGQVSDAVSAAVEARGNETIRESFNALFMRA